MEIYDSTDGDVLVLTPNGNLCETDETLVLESRFAKALGAKSNRIVLDCASVGQVSSTAVRTLLMTVRKLERVQGRLVLCALSPKVRDAFTVSGFDKDFTIVMTRDEALVRAREAVELQRKKKARAEKVADPVVPEPQEAAEPATILMPAPPALAALAEAAPAAPAAPAPAAVAAPVAAPAVIPASQAEVLAAALLTALSAPAPQRPAGPAPLPQPDALAARVLDALASGRTPGASL
jgi:anti-anti-sigma factor